MILRGAQIHRDGHGKSGLLLNPTLSRNSAPLPSVDVLTNTRTSLFDCISFFIQLQRGGATPRSDCSIGVRKPFHVTRARFRLVHSPRA